MNTRNVLTLSLRATDTRDGRVLDRTFDRFPIRIGRNALNDLQLDFKFVSQFHALLEKTAEGGVVLRDLGSLNGSVIGGKPVQAHQRTDLVGSGGTFEIGPVKFQCALGTTAKAAGDEQTAVMLALSEDPALQNATEAFQAIVGDAAHLRGQDPRDVALRGLKRLAAMYVPEASLDDPENVIRFLAKMKQALDLLFGAFIPLRDGSRQIQLQVDAAARGQNDAWAAAASAETPAELAKQALDWRNPSTETLHAIQNAFADFIIHQVTVVDGVVQGVRRLFEETAPSAIEERFVKQGSSLRFGPWRSAALWQLYSRVHGELVGNVDGALRRVFGEEVVTALRLNERGKKAP